MEAESEEIVREVRIAASPEEVFTYFTDAEKLVVWKAMRAELDARPGGVFLMDVTGRGDVARGTFLRSIPPIVSCSPGAGWTTTCRLRLLPAWSRSHSPLTATARCCVWFTAVSRRRSARAVPRDGLTTWRGSFWLRQGMIQGPILGLAK
jgi:hypothetical protein